ncbi:MAG TPA: glycosyltransferase family 39 protein, partial [Burkholderiaceae bacterium]|nr:glycosyltransferase family 39 protein [Burkholderiaceae bacterium]
MAEAAAPTRPSGADRRWVIGWALVLLLVALAGLGGAPLFDVDEGAFSEATREMLASGDWGHTTLNGEPRWDKPMFSYWMQSLSVAAFGLHEAALRLPSALASWGWALALLLFAAPRWGRSAGMAAGGLLLSALGVVVIGRAATADALLNLWLTLATLDLWRHLEADGAPAGRVPLRRAALWIAFGLLTKGPVAVLIPGAAVGLWLLTGPWREIGSRLRALLGDGLAWAILLGLGLPWYGYAYLTYGREFVDGFILKHNLQRYGGTLEGHSGSLFYYVVVLPLLLLPWTPLALAVLRRAVGTWRQDRLGRFLLGWAGFVLVFFSFSGTKLPHYVLYGISPIALLAGRVLARWLGDRDRRADGPARPRAV